MTSNDESHRQDRLALILAAARRHLDAAEAVRLGPFLHAYFARVPVPDIAETPPETLFAAAYAHWRLGCARPLAVPRIRAYNPRLEEDGWHSDHTVVEVVTDDMPFLVGSVTADLGRRDLAVHLIIHPVIRILRDEQGRFVELTENETEGLAESFIHVEITRQPEAELDRIASDVGRVLADVRAAVTDLPPARVRLREIIATLPPVVDGLDEADLEEVRAFLGWLYETHFTFLGMRAYRVLVEGQENIVAIEAGSGLGIMRSSEFIAFENLRDGAPLPPAGRAFFLAPDILTVTKSHRRSTVSRPVHMDTIVIKRYGEGRVLGFHIIAGLFGSAAYTRSARNVPLLRRKIERVLARAGFAPRSHDARALVNILETFPRDELFQVSEDYLFTVALGILDLQQRPRVKLFVRSDEFDRFVSCLVYVPRDRYNTELRRTVQTILERAFAGAPLAHYTQVTDAPLARLQIYLRTRPGAVPEADTDAVEAEIVAATRAWSDHLLTALNNRHGEEEGARLYRRYAHAFPPGYRERFSAEYAIPDIDRIETTLASGSMQLALYRPPGALEDEMRFKIFHADRPLPLSDVLPVLENLGLRVIDEMPHAVWVRNESGNGGRKVMIHDFGLETESGRRVDLASARDRFFAAFLAVWRGDVESDRFNALVFDAGLAWREISVLRAYAHFLRQAGILFSQSYIEQAVITNPEIAGRLVALFHARFDPKVGEREVRADGHRAEIATLLDQVTNADDDRILRRFLNLVEVTLRTNYFQNAGEGGSKPYLALKLDSSRIDELPLPRPMVEVFVYAPTMEGIHLRGGKVARGGIRWSDRREDFRTEILGLMKAQMVKNAVIVPVGAKGGFVLKHTVDTASREGLQAAGIEAYRTLIRGLLDVTDNLVDGKVAPPPQVIRHDGDDPYLVVAADKGTATFSDIANAISADYHFWLGDAFASGGSQGYDHKKMGITARGAWESVKRHFREMGRDIQTQPFTCVGVGDMSGDVFGNGMLLSQETHLLAAFDHRHIFIDPAPDPAVAFAERQRLFALLRSSWADYDQALLSPGGKVFERTAKVLALTPEIRERFAIAADRVTPAELVRSLLGVEVDLLWFGGIGTFIKATEESHAEAGDRSNDSLRINAGKLRCKVIGEGANLGVTQRGRIEFAARGGRINTDFIDNSAGVDCSDHEVNIKILLDAAVSDGDLTPKQRNQLLTEMIHEVAALVLRDNYAQTQAISLIANDGLLFLDNQARLMRTLERQGRLNRAVEYLPDDEALVERAQAEQGLTRPEIAVLFSYCKIWLADELLRSDLPGDAYLADGLVQYFPKAIGDRFSGRISGHRLRRELIATLTTNSLINRMGGTFITDIAEKTGARPVDIARAYLIAREVYGVRSLWQGIEALDGRVTWATQVRLFGRVSRLIERATLWFLRHGGTPLEITVNISAFDTAIAAIADHVEDVLPDSMRASSLATIGEDETAGVPAELARRIAALSVMASAPDWVRLAAARGQRVETVAGLYFAVGETFGFSWLRRQAEGVAAPGYWQRLALAALIDELYEHQVRLVERIMPGGEAPAAAVAVWSERRSAAIERARALLAELKAAPALDLSMIAVASRQLRTLPDS